MDIKNPQRGGAELYTWEICKRLIKDGNSVTFITSRFAYCKDNEFINEINIIRLGSIMTYFIRAFFWVKANKNRFGLCIETINGIPFMLPLILRNCRHKIIIFHLPTFRATSLKLPIIGPFEFMLSRWILKVLYRNKDIVTDSLSSKSELEKIGLKNIIIAEDGLHANGPEYYDPNRKELSAVILGPLKPWKRIEHGILAFTFLKPPWKLEIIGVGKKGYIKKLNKVVDTLNLRDRVTFYGFITEEEKNNIIKRSFLNIITSEKEGFSLTAIECARHGSVSVAYNVPGVRDAVKPNITSILVDDGNVKKLGRELYLLSQDTKRLYKMSKAAFEFSNMFTWDLTYRKIIPFISGSDP